VEGNGFMNLELKKVIRNTELGLFCLKAGKGVMVFLWRRLFRNNKIQKTQKKKNKIEKIKNQSQGNFTVANKDICKRGKIGFRACRIIKDRYF